MGGTTSVNLTIQKELQKKISKEMEEQILSHFFQSYNCLFIYIFPVKSLNDQRLKIGA